MRRLSINGSQITTRFTPYTLALSVAIVLVSTVPECSWATEGALGNEGVPTKATVMTCSHNPDVQALCSGNYSDLIDRVRVDATGKVYVAVTQEFVDEVEASAACVLVSGVYISVFADGDGGEDNQLNTLYMSWVTDAFISIKVAALIANGNCYIKNLSALYGEQP